MIGIFKENVIVPPPDQRYPNRRPIKEDFRHTEVKAWELLQRKMQSVLSEKESKRGSPGPPGTGSAQGAYKSEKKGHNDPSPLGP